MNKPRISELPLITTTEELATRFSSAKILTLGEWVIMAGYRYNGLNENCWYAAIYEFISDGRTCEDKIRFVEVSDEFFPDDGHAVKWAMNA